jgi:uncharacterized protein (DUF3084 family)
LQAETKKEKLKEEVDNLIIQHRKEKDEPESLEKSNVNLKKSVTKVQQDLDNIKAENQAIEEAIAKDIKA